MVKKLSSQRVLWALLGVMSLVAAAVGVFNQEIYGKVVSNEVMPGTVSQDVVAILAAVLLLSLAAIVRDSDIGKQVVAFGLVGFLFYAYGIYVIERIYTVYYLLYLAIFSLSFYTLVYGVAGIRQELVQRLQLPRRTRIISILFTLVIVVMFSALWVSALLPRMATGEKPEFFYSVFIIDLAFIMPAFGILAVMNWRKQGLGLLLLPAMYVLGITLLFPVGLGEFFKPAFGMSTDWVGARLYLGVPAAFLVMAWVHLRGLSISRS